MCLSGSIKTSTHNHDSFEIKLMKPCTALALPVLLQSIHLTIGAIEKPIDKSMNACFTMFAAENVTVLSY